MSLNVNLNNGYVNLDIFDVADIFGAGYPEDNNQREGLIKINFHKYPDSVSWISTIDLRTREYPFASTSQVYEVIHLLARRIPTEDSIEIE